MRIAYIAHLGETDHGVHRKILHQAECWRSFGHNTELFLTRKNCADDPSLYRAWPRYNLLNPHSGLLQHLNEFSPDCIYIREMFFSPFLLLLLAKHRRRIFVEINANTSRELRSLATRSFADWRGYMIYRASGSVLIASCRGLVCVTQELADAPEFSRARNRFVAPNTIAFERAPIRKKNVLNGPVRLIFMGSPSQPWHGTDYLPKLAGILGPQFHIDVFGPEISETIPSNLTLHGYQPLTVCNEFMALAHIGIGTLALHRNGMNEACPLKVREYLACGLPVVTAYQDTAFLRHTPDWVCQLPNSQEGFFAEESIRTLKNFCLRHRNTIVNHEASAPYIDSMHLEARKLQQLHHWLQ